MGKKKGNIGLNRAKRAQKAQKKKQNKIRMLTGRSGNDGFESAAAKKIRSPVVDDYQKTRLSELLEKNAPQILESLEKVKGEAFYSVFLTYVLDDSKATQINTSANDSETAWNNLLRQAKKKEGKSLDRVFVRWVRVDWVVERSPKTYRALCQHIESSLNGYYQHGIALDHAMCYAFLEPELNANGMLFTDSVDQGQWLSTLNPQRFLAYCQKKYGSKVPLDLSDAANFYVFTTQGCLLTAETCQPIPSGARFRQTEQLDSSIITSVINAATRFLASQILPNGRFVYGIVPDGNKTLTGYNAMRHAGAVYSLLDAWNGQGPDDLKQSIDRAVNYLVKKLLSTQSVNGKSMTFLVDRDEIKAGGLGICLLMLVKYTELTNDDKYRDIMAGLAEAILHIQQSDGSFIHVLHAENLKIKDHFRTIYYDGEATFGLMAYYRLTKGTRWLEASVKAFDHFCRQDHWKAHDHWLAYAANELTRYVQEDRYFDLGLKNVFDHLDFILERETYYPTLGELVMASHQLIKRIAGLPDKSHLLKRFDLEKFYRALEYRMHYLLEGFYWPEIAMFFDDPGRIVGSFYIRHHAMRTRIDDVQHYLSGFLAYLRHYLPTQKIKPDKIIPSVDPISDEQILGKYQAAGVLAWGGDVNLGRRQHYRTRQLGFAQTLAIPELQAADLSVVNLECVISTLGEQGVRKGEGGPYYYRARPEMVQVLTEAGVNLVTVANNHSGDYGPEALMQQQTILQAVGIDWAGSGHNRQAAFTPVFCQANDVKVAIFSIDSTKHQFAAQENTPGAAYLPPDQLQLWQDTLQPLITRAKQQADVVVVAVHWGANHAPRPDQDEIAIGHAIIDAGADAILGASAHRLQGIEVYRGNPIIHDAGDLLMDAIRSDFADSGVFQLGLTKLGVSWVRFVPVGTGFGFSQRVIGDQALKQIKRYADQCLSLGTQLQTGSNDAYLLLEQTAPALQRQAEKRSYQLQALDAFGPQDEGRTDQVPEEYTIEPVFLNGLTLLGIRVHPTTLTRRRMLWVETWWRAEQTPDEDLRLDYQAFPQTQHKMPVWGKAMDHDPCDWMQPTRSWQPGVIYRDFYGLRPPQFRHLINDRLQLEVRVLGSRGQSEPYVYPSEIELNIPGFNSADVTQPQYHTFSKRL